MTAPVYIHTPTGDQFHYVGATPALGVIVLAPVTDAGAIDLGDVWLVTPAAFADLFVKVDDLLDLARAVGVLVEEGQVPGDLAGPAEWWTDENLATVFGLDKAAGGDQ